MNDDVNRFEPKLTESERIAKRINKAVAYGCRLLGAREYSRKAISIKLQNKGFEPVEREQALKVLIENNWLSDERYCEAFIRAKINAGQGFARISYDLVNRGISKLMINQQLDNLEVCWQSLCDEVATRKLANSPMEDNLKARQKLERFLRYRGFSGEQVNKTMRRILNNKVGE